MASSIKRRPTRLAAFVALAMFAGGCELIVDFDRTKIDGGGDDGSLPDVTTQDVSNQDVVTQDVVNDTKNDVVTQPDAGDGGGVTDASDGGAGNDAADADDGATE